MYERFLLYAACLLACGPVTLQAQGPNFAGAQTGISTLSADGRSIITAQSTSISLYKPENGPTFQGIFGRHLSNYLSVQATYGWNRNSLTLTASQASENHNAFYEQARSATQYAAVGELLLYFRKRGRSVRPYLSAGGGAIHITSSQKTIGSMLEEGISAPGGFSSTKPALRAPSELIFSSREDGLFGLPLARPFGETPSALSSLPPVSATSPTFKTSSAS